MKTEISDILLINRSGKKQIVRVLSQADPTRLVVATEKSISEGQSAEFSIKPEDIVLNYGDEPNSDNISKYRRTTSCKLAQIRWFYVPTPEYEAKLVDAFDKCYDKYVDLGWIFDKTMVIEVYQNRGQKMIGWYATSKKEESPDVLAVRCLEEDPELIRVIHHEFIHRVQQRSRIATSAKAAAEWVKSYHDHLIQKEYDKAFISSLADDFKKSECSLADFAKSQDEEKAPVIKQIIKHLKQAHKLRPADINALHYSGVDITKMWPTSVKLTAIDETQIGSYAAKNVAEWMAEAMSFYLVGKQLPQSLQELVEKTLTFTHESLITSKHSD